MSAARDVAPEDCIKPNTLYFADESSYAISDLTDAQVEKLVCLPPCPYISSLLTLRVVSPTYYQQNKCCFVSIVR
jgi:hypothetical protein